DLERIILHCLEKRPSARPASAGEVAEALAPFAGDAGAPLSLRVRRVLASDTGSEPPPPSAGTAPTLTAAPAPPSISPGPVTTSRRAPPRREASWMTSALTLTAIALAFIAGFALVHRSPEAPRVSSGAEPPDRMASAPASIAPGSRTATQQDTLVHPDTTS